MWHCSSVKMMSNDNSAYYTSNEKGKDMEIHKQFSFVGNLKKLHEKDDLQIENFNATIYCYKNGSVLLEIDSETHERLNCKKFYDSAPIYNLKTTVNINQEQFDSSLFHLDDEAEKELVRTAYKGDYVIEGNTIEQWFIRANIADASFTVSFGNINKQKGTENNLKHLVKLSDLYIDYNPQFVSEKAIESIYGIANLEVVNNFSTNFLDSKHEFSLISVSRGKNESEILSAEIKFRVIDEENAEETSYDTYFAWFELLISFATGKCIKHIYNIETYQCISGQKNIESWSGEQTFIKGLGTIVIQRSHLQMFIKQCASKVTWENFSDKGLGSALRWYVETFTTNAVSVEFILLCTVLETLYYHRNKGKQVSFKTKVNFLVEIYNVPYKDLFPEFEFIAIRNKIAHDGFGGLDAAPEVRKLANFIVRLILSMLEYQGDYMESIEIELEDGRGYTKHELICKRFPFQEV